MEGGKPFPSRVRIDRSLQKPPFLNKPASFPALTQRRGNTRRSQMLSDTTAWPSCRWPEVPDICCLASSLPEPQKGMCLQRVICCYVVLRCCNNSKHQKKPKQNQLLQSPFQWINPCSGWARAGLIKCCVPLSHKITVTTTMTMYLHDTPLINFFSM